MKQWFIRIIALFCFLNSSAYIYEIKVLRKWDAERRKYLYFIGLSDFHDKTNSANQSQLNRLEQLCAQLNTKTCKFTIEDLSSKNAQGRRECGQFFINSRGGVLGGLAEKIKSMGFDVDNAEFRYCRVSSLGPVLNNLEAPLQTMTSAMHVRMSALVDEIMGEMRIIARYNDGYILNKQYDSMAKEVVAAMKALKLDHALSLTVAEYLANYSNNKNRLELLKKLLTFDSNVLDSKIVHSVLEARDKDKVIAIAGGAHIARACELLATQGYQPLDTTKITFAREHDLQKCLGSHIVDGAFCVKPAPIDLDRFEKAVALP